MTKALRAVVYTRQSLDKDGTGLAVARQLEADEKLCADRGWDIVSRESDNDASGYSGRKRPGYERVIAMMRNKEVDVVAVWAVDRLTRRLADLAELIDLCEETGVRIATVSGDLDLSTPAGKLMARILGSVAQGEVETKAARQQLANRQAALAGKARMGSGRPFGWQPDREHLDPAEAPAVADACGTILAGGTLAAVIRDWDKRGVYPHQRPKGHPFGPVRLTGWTRTSVREILLNPRNAGIAVHRGIEVGRGNWESLVPEETYRAVAAVLRDPARKVTQGVTTMLGNLALCRCGSPVTGATRESRNGKPGLKQYRCGWEGHRGKAGPHVHVRQDLVDEWVWALVEERLTRDDAAELVAPAAGTDTMALRDEAEAVRKRLERLGPLFAAGMITEQDLTGGRAAGEQRLAEIRSRLEAAGQGSAVARARAAVAAGEDLDVSLKRAAVRALMTVTLMPPGRGARRWDPEKVVSAEWVPLRA